ncbi:MAG: preprotein translocase subunit YajC [Oscillospiraceae bacterium]|jgi:preprotein translocase subunit YajC|nr:preprotein translocase subunit YajC [Oscillospiraceae bacterium]
MNLTWLMNAVSGSGTQQGGGWQMILLLVAMVGVMYLTMIRPQRKRQKEEQQMRDSVEVGDEITTIGGILGRVITVKEDSIIIETGADRTKLRILRTAVGINNTAQEKLAAERDAARKAQEEARATRAAESGKDRKKSKKSKE